MANPLLNRRYRDTAPRGGPVFRVVSVDHQCGHIHVENVAGEPNPRTIKLSRLHKYHLLDDPALPTL